MKRLGATWASAVAVWKQTVLARTINPTEQYRALIQSSRKNGGIININIISWCLTHKLPLSDGYPRRMEAGITPDSETIPSVIRKTADLCVAFLRWTPFCRPLLRASDRLTPNSTYTLRVAHRPSY